MIILLILSILSIGAVVLTVLALDSPPLRVVDVICECGHTGVREVVCLDQVDERRCRELLTEHCPLCRQRTAYAHLRLRQSIAQAGRSMIPDWEPPDPQSPIPAEPSA